MGLLLINYYFHILYVYNIYIYIYTTTYATTGNRRAIP